MFAKSSTIELFDLQKIQPAHKILEERLQMRELRGMPEDRVDNMIKKIYKTFPARRPDFLLCVLPVRKNCDIYGLSSLPFL